MNRIILILKETKYAKILLPIGLLLIIIGCVVLFGFTKTRNYEEKSALITKSVKTEDKYTDEDGNNHSESYEITVEYTIEGMDYEKIMNVDREYKKGDRIKIYYNPKNPNEITDSSSSIIPTLILLVGLVSIIWGLIEVIKQILIIIREKPQNNNMMMQ